MRAKRRDIEKDIDTGVELHEKYPSNPAEFPTTIELYTFMCMMLLFYKMTSRNIYTACKRYQRECERYFIH